MSSYPVPPADEAREIVKSFIPSREANGIVKFIMHPCAAPWFVYVEALAPAFMELILFVITLTPEDVAKSWIKRSSGHIARGRVKGEKRIKPQWWDGGRRAIFYVDDIVERGLFWWAIADLTITGAYKWTTIINETAYCTGGGLFHSWVPGGSHACGPAWAGFPVNQLLTNTQNWPWTSLSVTPPGGPTFAMVIMEPQFNSPFNWGTNFQIRIGRQSGLGTEWVETEPVQLKIGERTQVVVSMTFENHVAVPATIVWAWRYDGGAIPLVDHGRVDVIVGQTLP